MKFLEKTAMPASMAGDAAHLFDLKEHCIVITIKSNLAHFLEMPG